MVICVCRAGDSEALCVPVFSTAVLCELSGRFLSWFPFSAAEIIILPGMYSAVAR